MHEVIPRSIDKTPPRIGPPQIIPGSEFDIFSDEHIAQTAPLISRVELETIEDGMGEDAATDQGIVVATVEHWLDATNGRMADGFDEADSRIHPDERSSGPLPGREGIKKLPLEVRAADEAFRSLRAALLSVGITEITGAREYIRDKDPDVHLLKAISEISALRNTLHLTRSWQPRFEKLARAHMNELASATALALRHLAEYPNIQQALLHLSTFVERYADAYFPQQARKQRDKAKAERRARADRFKKFGLAGLTD